MEIDEHMGKKMPPPTNCLGSRYWVNLYSSITVSMSALSCEESFISVTPKVVMHDLKKHEGFDLV